VIISVSKDHQYVHTSSSTLNNASRSISHKQIDYLFERTIRTASVEVDPVVNQVVKRRGEGVDRSCKTKLLRSGTGRKHG
jgi:hypothetical protein